MSKGGIIQSKLRQCVILNEQEGLGVTLDKCNMLSCDFSRRTAQFASSNWFGISVNWRFATQTINNKFRQSQNTIRILERELRRLWSISVISFERKMWTYRNEILKQCLMDRYNHSNHHRTEVIINKINRFLVACYKHFLFNEIFKYLNYASIYSISKVYSLHRVHRHNIFRSTVEDVRKIWSSRKLQHIILWLDYFKIEVNTHVVHIAETYRFGLNLLHALTYVRQG